MARLKAIKSEDVPVAAPEPIRRKLTQSQIYVLTTATEQANQIKQQAVALVCTELGLALPTNGQSISIENGELVIA